MINIAICDDDILTTTLIEEKVSQIAKDFDIKTNCDVFFDGSTIMESIQQGVFYDLIYLDIEMNKVNGIYVAEQIKNMSLPTLIIYISNYEKYLKELFNTEPFRFLSKPIDSESFRNTFLAAYKRIQEKTDYFAYTYNKAFIKIPLNQIYYFESDNRVIYIHTITDTDLSMDEKKEKYYRFYGKINEVEQQLSDHIRFIRIHQSYLVNFDYIRKMTFENVTMMNGKTLKISEERQKRVRERFCVLAGIEV